MALRYQTGEEIYRGDRVTYGGNAGVIELVVEALTGEPEEDWLLETNGSWHHGRRAESVRAGLPLRSS
jgi:hypothetical protein